MFVRPLYLAPILAFACYAGLNCHAPTPTAPSICEPHRSLFEPDLMGWDPASRAKLRTLSSQGPVAVRYEIDGCDVQLKVLDNCVALGVYDYAPYPSKERRIIDSEGELHASLPLGALRWRTQLQHGNALRTDRSLVGVFTLPVQGLFEAGSLQGTGCEEATHVVSKIYVGGFSLFSGSHNSLSTEADLFSAIGGGGSYTIKAVQEIVEGDPRACETALSSGEPSILCGVPLRVGLLAIKGRAASSTPSIIKGVRGLGAGEHTCDVNNQDVCNVICELGQDSGCSILAHSYLREKPGGKELTQAVKLLERTCDNGYSGEDCRVAGLIHWHAWGTSIAKNDSRAGVYFEKGCELGDVSACGLLGVTLLAKGLPKDMERAESLLKGGCEIDEPLSCYSLGGLYSLFSEPPDYRLAASAYEKACNLNNANACYDLGLQYCTGEGVKEDGTRCGALWTKACDLGNGEACGGLKKLKRKELGGFARP